MLILRRNVVCLLITCVTLVLGSAPAIAAPASCSEGIGEVAAPASPHGIKSAAVVRAVKLVAKGIRIGNTHFGTLVKRLDKNAVGPFLKHSAQIADVLEDIAKIPDLALGIVGQRLFHLLSDKQGAFKIDPGLAKDIVEEIVGAINALI